MTCINKFIPGLSRDDFDYRTYMAAEKEAMLGIKKVEPLYEWESTSKVKRIVMEIFKGILSVLFIPYGLYRLAHLIAGKIVVPAQILSNPVRDKLNLFRRCTASGPSKSPLIVKRISVAVDGKKVDAMLIGKRENLSNKKWTLFSNPNAASMEKMFDRVEQESAFTDRNFLLYNYQGVGASEGWATRDGIVNAHKAMLAFLEDEEKGIGAKEIAQMSLSLGGGVQGAAMKNHTFKAGIKYVCEKEQTFSKISKVPGPFLGFILRVLGWELSGESSSIRLEKEGVPEIVVQNASKESPTDASEIQGDGVIPADGAQAKYLLSYKYRWKHKKLFGLKLAPHGLLSFSMLRKIHGEIDRAFSTS